MTCHQPVGKLRNFQEFFVHHNFTRQNPPTSLRAFSWAKVQASELSRHQSSWESYTNSPSCRGYLKGSYGLEGGPIILCISEIFGASTCSCSFFEVSPKLGYHLAILTITMKTPKCLLKKYINLQIVHHSKKKCWIFKLFLIILLR